MDVMQMMAVNYAMSEIQREIQSKSHLMSDHQKTMYKGALLELCNDHLSTTPVKESSDE